ncbi:IncP-type conjugal transfer protein TraG [Sedimentitalea todarodis]|uniref:IncP-type conjugal transfer protein TraG n=1 Tax=Sedimentitalea todarodis TaxID=1631240 RepID=A0ABU3VL35_9RHOB|nr:IncP-type conjugal transfer protein TraG [Sedimentitalea todarodis]MDU9006922.1 IncP-type conjugal transfer protein TraG [Sedimentitalea todarodis]
MYADPHNSDAEPHHYASATHAICSDLEIYGYRHSENDPDPRDVPEDRLIAVAVADIFDALVATMADTSLDADLDEMLWSTVNMFHRATDRIERKLDDNEQAQKRRQREQDGSEVKSVQLEHLIAIGQTLLNRRDCMEVFRDHAADHYLRLTGSPWATRSGSRVNHRNLTAAMIDSRDFLAAKTRSDTEVYLPAGTKIAFTGGLEFNDHQLIWDKGVGLVIPSLLTWPGSAIVHDIKGENWQLTAGFRARHGQVLLFDPTDTKSNAYNPLLEVRRGEWEVRDVQNIADILVDPEGSLEKRNHWEKTSHALLVGTILHVLYAEADKTLAGVANFLSDPKRSIEATLQAMMATAHLGAAGAHPVIASAARELLNKSGNERSGVLSTAMSFLGLYRDPVVAQVTRRCDWRIAQLVESDEPVTLYLVVPPSDINRTKPLIRLILNQIGRRLTEDLQGKTRHHRLLLMLDEFPALGRLDFFESALAFMAGYGIKSFLIAQSLNQIEKAYGPNNSILDNCHVRVSFATNDERTAKRVSDALGTATEMRAMKNYAGHRLSPWLGHLMVSRQETARPLLTPGEVMQLPPSDEIVMVAGTPPVRAKKARYFEDDQFQTRILPAPTAQTPAVRASTDDWTTRPLPPRPKPGDPDVLSEQNETGEAQHEKRQQPEFDQQPPMDPSGPIENEFETEFKKSATNRAVQLTQFEKQARQLARQASMDPNDGIDM